MLICLPCVILQETLEKRGKVWFEGSLAMPSCRRGRCRGLCQRPAAAPGMASGAGAGLRGAKWAGTQPAPSRPPTEFTAAIETIISFTFFLSGDKDSY